MIENIIFRYPEKCFREIDPQTIQHAHEILNDRRKDEDLRWCLINKKLPTTLFFTADFLLYDIENGETILYWGDREHNLIIKNIQEVKKQVMQNRPYYHPKKEEVGWVKKAETTLRVKLNELRTEGIDNERCCCFKFEDINPPHTKLNLAERNLIGRVLGQGKDFIQNWEMLRDEGIPEIRIFLHTPQYVQKHAQNGAYAVTAALDQCYIQYEGNLTMRILKGGNTCDLYAEDIRFTQTNVLRAKRSKNIDKDNI